MKLQINKLSKEYQDHQVLKGINITIQDRDFIGLIGPNGSGKTTLLKIIAGIEVPTDGSITKIPQNFTIGYIPQVSDFQNDLTILECLASGEDYKTFIALDKLGLNDIALKKFGNLSSGQKTKIYLARILLETPDLLILDEPTNHLDSESLKWLEEYLKSYQGACLVVSHDRRFLDNTVTKIFELNDGDIKIYGGNYSFYKQQKNIGIEAQERMYVDQEKRSKRLINRVMTMKNKTRQLEAVTNGSDHYMRRKAAKSASRAKSTEKMLLKQLDEKGVEKPVLIPELSVLFKPRRSSSQSVAYLKNVSVSFGKQKVINNLSLLINQGERITILGPNGSGKSTLIRLILNQVQPNTGKIEYGNNIDVGYLPQEHIKIESELSTLDYLTSNSKIDQTSAFRLAKRFLFSDDDIKLSVNKLSSGQKSKLALATIMSSGANFIILDEPTNYLDIPSREALESALVSYDGTLLVVSHDRYFLDRIGLTKIINLN